MLGFDFFVGGCTEAVVVELGDRVAGLVIGSWLMRDADSVMGELVRS